MINTILDLIYDYIHLRDSNKDTTECKKSFANSLLSFIDFRIKANKKDQTNQAIKLLSAAPLPESENFDILYKEWYEKMKQLFE